MKTTNLTPAEIATRVALIKADMGDNLQRITRIERGYAYCEAHGTEVEVEFTIDGDDVFITSVFDLNEYW